MNQRIESQVECASCPWNRNCIEPPLMTKEEIEAKIERASPTKEMGERKAEQSIIGGMMSAIFYSGKDVECPACLTFIKQLRESSDLSTYIKGYMKKK